MLSVSIATEGLATHTSVRIKVPIDKIPLNQQYKMSRKRKHDHLSAHQPSTTSTHQNLNKHSNSNTTNDSTTRRTKRKKQKLSYADLAKAYKGFRPPNSSYTLDRVDIHSLSSAEFYERYIKQRKPCVLYDAQSALITPQMRKWLSIPYLVEKAGDKEVQVERSSTHSNHTPHAQVEKQTQIEQKQTRFGLGLKQKMKFKDFLSAIQKGDQNLYLSTQTSESNLMNDSYLISEPLQSIFGDFPTRPRLFDSLVPNQYNAWIGHSMKSSSGLHSDMADNCYILLQGKKKFTLYAPSDFQFASLYGRVTRVHWGGLLNYEGEETNACGETMAEQRSRIVDDLLYELSRCEDDQRREKMEDELYQICIEQLRKGEIQEDDEFRDDYVDDDQIGSNDDEDEDGEEEENVHPSKWKACQGVALSQFSNDSESESIDNSTKKTKTEEFIDFPPSFSKINTDSPTIHKDFRQFAKATPVYVTLQAGDALYLPASWLHEVRSESDVADEITNSYQSAANDKFIGHFAMNYWFYPPDLETVDAYTHKQSYQRKWEQLFDQLNSKSN